MTEPFQGRTAAELVGAGWTVDEIEAELRAGGKPDGEISIFTGRSPAAAPPAAPLTWDAIRAMPKAEQRKVANERWPEVEAAMTGKRPPGPLTAAELANVDKLDPDTINANWDQVKAELARRGQKGAKP